MNSLSSRLKQTVSSKRRGKNKPKSHLLNRPRQGHLNSRWITLLSNSNRSLNSTRCAKITITIASSTRHTRSQWSTEAVGAAVSRGTICFRILGQRKQGRGKREEGKMLLIFRRRIRTRIRSRKEALMGTNRSTRKT